MLFHKCLPDLLQRSNLHATAANVESCWGVLGDPAKAALLEIKWGRRLGTRNLPGNVRPWKTVTCPEYWVRRAWLSGQHTLGFGLQTGQSGQPSDPGNTETHPVPVRDTWVSGSLPGLLLSINSSVWGGKSKPWSTKCSFKRLTSKLLSAFVCFHLPY